MPPCAFQRVVVHGRVFAADGACRDIAVVGKEDIYAAADEIGLYIVYCPLFCQAEQEPIVFCEVHAASIADSSASGKALATKFREEPNSATLQLFKPNSVTLQRCNSVTLQPNLQPSTFNFSIALPSFLCYPSPRSARHTPRGATSSIPLHSAKLSSLRNLGTFKLNDTLLDARIHSAHSPCFQFGHPKASQRNKVKARFFIPLARDIG